MLNSMSLKNFKAFSKLEALSIKPITIICGTNSCGKSSLLQSLLLWKQSLESRNYDQSLLMNGRLVHLGTFNNSIYKHDSSSSMGFDFTFEFTRTDLYRTKTRFRFPWHVLIREFFSNDKELKDKDIIYKLRYSIELENKSSSNDTSFTGIISPKSIVIDSSACLSDGKIVKGACVNIGKIDNSAEYEMIWTNLSTIYDRNNDNFNGREKIKSLNIINLVPVQILSNKEDVYFSNVLSLFHRTGDILRSIFGSITYLGPLREEPARRYIYENEVVEIGVKGENAAYIYMTEGDKKIKSHFFYNSVTDSFEKKHEISLRDSVKQWLDIMGINSFDANRESEIIRLLLNSSSNDDTRVNIADVGFGVSQVFPIVLEGLRMSQGETMILEQPEIHLHPKLQMQLGDYLISLALSGKKVIIETHSDHIVNRLVRRMIEDPNGELADLMAIYFVRQSDNGSIIEPISLSQDDGIANWPDDFFDQAATEQQLIMRALITRKRRN